MRISDWSSDVCSSDLHAHRGRSDDAVDGQLVPFQPLADQFGAARPALVDRAVEIALDGHVPTRFGVAQDGQTLQNLSPRRCAIPRFCRPCAGNLRSEEHTSELQSLMRISYAVFC